MKIRGIAGVAIVVAALFVAGCNNHSSSGSGNTPPPPEKPTVTADAGPDQTKIVANAEIQLDGSASHSDPTLALQYTWSITAAPANSIAQLSDETTPSPRFTPDLPGRYEFTLNVSDGDGTSDQDTVVVTVNYPPVAVIDSSRLGNRITLDGNASSDDDGDSLAYTWSLETAPADSTASLGTTTEASTTLIADTEGEYRFRLVVHDGLQESVAAETTVQLPYQFDLAYIKRPVAGLASSRGPRNVTNDPAELNANDPEAGITAGDVYVRNLTTNEEINVTGLITAPDPGMKSAGDVSDLEVSYDGTKLVFALHQGMYVNRTPDEQPTWSIYEFDLTQPVTPDTNPRKVMNNLEAEKGDDLDPHYLPDGRIVFTSMRQHQSRGLQAITGLPTFPYLDEDRRGPVFVLHVMDGNGQNVQQITFNQSHDINPTVLDNGKILFSRWEHTGTRNAFSLYTVNPDGSGLDVLYGTHSYDSVNGPRAYIDAKQLPDGQLISTLTSYQRPRTTITTSGPIRHYNDGELVMIDQENFVEIDDKRFTSTSPNTVGQVSATDGRVPVDGSVSPYGRYYSPHPIWDNHDSQRLLVSWTICRLTTADNAVHLPCIDSNLTDPNLIEDEPLFGIYIYDLTTKLKKPIVMPEEGLAAVDPVAVMARAAAQIPASPTLPEPDVVLASKDVGIIHIKSVYDTEGNVAMVDKPLEPRGSIALTSAERAAIPMTTVKMDPLTGAMSDDSSRTDLVERTVADLSVLSDPAQTPGNDRVARFVRVTKAVPTIDDNNINSNDFGRSGGYEMREILGYAPVEPDGSVYMEVPANVPFTLQVLDAKGRAFMSHTSWLQLKPGEKRECNGCHSPRDGQQSINPGSPGSQFPNTDDVLTLAGETMAEARARQAQLNGIEYAALSMDMVDNNIWVNPDELTEYSYLGANGLVTPRPVSNNVCESDWNWYATKCRIVINYEEHIQPIWDAIRLRDIGNGLMDYRCTSCHNDDDPTSVPAGNLALDATSDININHTSVQAIRDNRTSQNRPASYEMLFITRPRMEVNANNDGTQFAVVRDANGQPIDVDGNIISETDFVNLQFINQRPPLVRGGAAQARNSPLVQIITGEAVGPITTPTIDHTQLLTDGEKRIIIEWIDNGGQVFNDPVGAAVQ